MSLSETKPDEIKVQILRGLFCVILVSTILTIYEVYLFYTNVVPTVQDAIDGGIRDLAHQLDQHTDVKAICLYKNQFSSVYKTLQDQENEYIHTINTYTKVSAVALLVVLVGSLVFIRSIVKQMRPTEGLQTYTWVVGITTVVLIMLFQYGFYFYGRKFKYLSSEGQEELLYHLSTRL